MRRITTAAFTSKPTEPWQRPLLVGVAAGMPGYRTGSAPGEMASGIWRIADPLTQTGGGARLKSNKTRGLANWPVSCNTPRFAHCIIAPARRLAPVFTGVNRPPIPVVAAIGLNSFQGRMLLPFLSFEARIVKRVRRIPLLALLLVLAACNSSWRLRYEFPSPDQHASLRYKIRGASDNIEEMITIRGLLFETAVAGPTQTRFGGGALEAAWSKDEVHVLRCSDYATTLRGAWTIEGSPTVFRADLIAGNLRRRYSLSPQPDSDTLEWFCGGRRADADSHRRSTL